MKDGSTARTSAERDQRWCANRRITRDDEWPVVDSLEYRCLHDVRRCAGGGDATVVQQDHAIGKSCHEVELVAH